MHAEPAIRALEELRDGRRRRVSHPRDTIIRETFGGERRDRPLRRRQMRKYVIALFERVAEKEHATPIDDELFASEVFGDHVG